MGILSITAILGIASTALCALGCFSQIEKNYRYKSVAGLSLTEAETRVWGKLPWILFAASCTQLDTPILLNTILSLILPIVLLFQFKSYSGKDRGSVEPTPMLGGRVYAQLALTLLALTVAFSFRSLLVDHQSLFLFLPVPATVVALLLGNTMQLLKNRTSELSVICPRRYACFALSNFFWLLYGLSKLNATGWNEASSLLLTTTLGFVLNLGILIQLRSHFRQNTSGTSLRWALSRT